MLTRSTAVSEHGWILSGHRRKAILRTWVRKSPWLEKELILHLEERRGSRPGALGVLITSPKVNLAWSQIDSN